MQQIQLAKGGGVLHAALNALRGAGTPMTRIARPAMVSGSPSSSAGQTAVLRPQQLTPGQQRIGKIILILYLYFLKFNVILFRKVTFYVISFKLNFNSKEFYLSDNIFSNFFVK